MDISEFTELPMIYENAHVRAELTTNQLKLDGGYQDGKLCIYDFALNSDYYDEMEKALQHIHTTLGQYVLYQDAHFNKTGKLDKESKVVFNITKKHEIQWWTEDGVQMIKTNYGIFTISKEMLKETYFSTFTFLSYVRLWKKIAKLRSYLEENVEFNSAKY